MIVIGVTGGVGTGKSSICRIFEKLGAVVFDADAITHQLMRPRGPMWRRIRARFGSVILTDQGEIDRKALGRIVFSSPPRLKELTQIIHPAVRAEIRKGLSKLRKRSKDAVAVLDVPLLVESAGAYPLDALVVVTAPRAAVLKRLRSRSGWDAREIAQRERFQWALREKVKRADFVVDNSGTRREAPPQVLRIWKQLMKEKGEGE